MSDKQMVFPKKWEEFRNTGLLLFINQFLHIFGWAIVVEVDEQNNIIKCYPARVKFRGFNFESQDEAFIKISEYMNNNSEELLRETKD